MTRYLPRVNSFPRQSHLLKDSQVVNCPENESNPKLAKPDTGESVSPSRGAKLASFCSRAFDRARNHCLGFVRRLVLSEAGREWEASTHHRVDEGHQRQLESGCTSFGSAVLPNCPSVLGTGGGGFRCEETKAATRNPARRVESEGKSLMPTTLLRPDTHLRIRYPVPHRGLIEYNVEADQPVDTFVLDRNGLMEFLDGKDDYIYSYYGGFTNRYKHHQEIKLPFRGWWYLIIRNPNKKESVAVHYEVSG